MVPVILRTDHLGFGEGGGPCLAAGLHPVNPREEGFEVFFGGRGGGVLVGLIPNNTLNSQ